MKCKRRNCENEFEPRSPKQLYCCKDCQKTYDSKNDIKFDIIINENGEEIFNVDLYFKSVTII